MQEDFFEEYEVLYPDEDEHELIEFIKELIDKDNNYE